MHLYAAKWLLLLLLMLLCCCVASDENGWIYIRNCVVAQAKHPPGGPDIPLYINVYVGSIIDFLPSRTFNAHSGAHVDCRRLTAEAGKRRSVIARCTAEDYVYMLCVLYMYRKCRSFRAKTHSKRPGWWWWWMDGEIPCAWTRNSGPEAIVANCLVFMWRAHRHTISLCILYIDRKTGKIYIIPLLIVPLCTRVHCVAPNVLCHIHDAAACLPARLPAGATPWCGNVSVVAAWLGAGARCYGMAVFHSTSSNFDEWKWQNSTQTDDCMSLFSAN